jgi:hypothetical protein
MRAQEARQLRVDNHGRWGALSCLVRVRCRRVWVLLTWPTRATRTASMRPSLCVNGDATTRQSCHHPDQCHGGAQGKTPGGGRGEIKPASVDVPSSLAMSGCHSTSGSTPGGSPVQSSGLGGGPRSTSGSSGASSASSCSSTITGSGSGFFKTLNPVAPSGLRPHNRNAAGSAPTRTLSTQPHRGTQQYASETHSEGQRSPAAARQRREDSKHKRRAGRASREKVFFGSTRRRRPVRTCTCSGGRQGSFSS